MTEARSKRRVLPLFFIVKSFKKPLLIRPLEVVHIFRSEYSDRNSPFHFWQTVSLPLLGNSVTKFKMTWAISIGRPDLIGKCRSIFLRYSHWSLNGHFGTMESTLGLSFKIRFRLKLSLTVIMSAPKVVTPPCHTHLTRQEPSRVMIRR